MTKPAEVFTLHTDSDLLARARVKLPCLSLAIKITDTIYYHLMFFSSAEKSIQGQNSKIIWSISVFWFTFSLNWI